MTQECNFVSKNEGAKAKKVTQECNCVSKNEGAKAKKVTQVCQRYDNCVRGSGRALALALIPLDLYIIELFALFSCLVSSERPFGLYKQRRIMLGRNLHVLTHESANGLAIEVVFCRSNHHVRTPSAKLRGELHLKPLLHTLNIPFDF